MLKSIIKIHSGNRGCNTSITYVHLTDKKKQRKKKKCRRERIKNDIQI